MMEIAGAINDKGRELQFHLLIKTLDLKRRRGEAKPRPPNVGVHGRQRKRFNVPGIIQVEMNR